jgi:hypothetical protein
MEDIEDAKGSGAANNTVDQNNSSTPATAQDNPTISEPEKDGSERTKLQTTIIMVALCVCLENPAPYEISK